MKAFQQYMSDSFPTITQHIVRPCVLTRQVGHNICRNLTHADLLSKALMVTQNRRGIQSTWNLSEVAYCYTVLKTGTKENKKPIMASWI